MRRFVLAQLRTTLGRLVAAGLAVVLGTTFVTATMMVGQVLNRTTVNAVSATYRGADVVVSEADADPAVIERARQLPEIDGFDAVESVFTDIVSGDRSVLADIGALKTSPELQVVDLSSGDLPSASGQIALNTDVAEQLKIVVGDQVTVRVMHWDPDTDESRNEDVPVQVVGLLTPISALTMVPTAVAVPQDVHSWMGFEDDESTVSEAVGHAAPGVTQQEAADAVAALDGWGDWVEITTADAMAQETVDDLTQGTAIFTLILLGFAGIALFVTGMVITNTFQVLVAQRRRHLALMRCVGATRKQIRRSVLLESVLLAVTSSVIGIVLGLLLVNGVATVFHRRDGGAVIPAWTSPSVWGVLLPLAAGVLVTVFASFLPAQGATRVPPVAALRPPGMVQLGAKAGVLRLIFSLLIVGAGVLLLVLGLFLVGKELEPEDDGFMIFVGFLLALAGGAVSFLGVILGTALFIPGLIRVLGRVLVGWAGVPGKLATANAVRNPKRTATTSAALLIGVTLVTMMTTGAAVVRATANQKLDDKFPVDLSISRQDWGTYSDAPTQEGIPSPVLAGLSEVDGVTARTELRGGFATLSATSNDGDQEVNLLGADRESLADVVRSEDLLDDLSEDTVLIPATQAEYFDVRDGVTVTLQADAGRVDLRAELVNLESYELIVTDQVLDRLLPDAPVMAVWLKLQSDADAWTVLRDVREAIEDTAGSIDSYQFEGAAVVRAMFEQVLRILLRVVTGLLAVAVIIAVIGVANTLSLSVVERTRESAVLRALGLTRRQLRAMLAVEGMLISGIGALSGIVLGVLYGWAGATALISVMWEPILTVPFGELLPVFAGGVVVGLLASVLPGRKAARTAPVAALGDE